MRERGNIWVAFVLLTIALLTLGVYLIFKPDSTRKEMERPPVPSVPPAVNSIIYIYWLNLGNTDLVIPNR